MVEHMNDVIDAYSVHIYWNYWDLPRMVFRLKDVRPSCGHARPEAHKPVFVTEFGVARDPDLTGSPCLQPGYWEDGTPDRPDQRRGLPAAVVQHRVGPARLLRHGQMGRVLGEVPQATRVALA